MFYGDLHFLDILLFAGVAAFLFYRLRNVLGKRTGFEKKPNISQEQAAENKNMINKTNDKSIPELTENIKELETAYKNLPGFNHILFLDGAKTAFETIVNLFNEGNKEGLKQLLTKNTHKEFCLAIDNNEKKEKYKILSIDIELIKKVWVSGKKIFITIIYLSKQINSDNDNQVTKKDSWTFEKNISSNDPRWFLSSS